MGLINIHDKYLFELAARDINPTQFIQQLLDQHFEPWKYLEYENEMIERALERLEPTDEDLEIVKKYLSYELLRDFKKRMRLRYDRSLPMFSLEYYMKRLSIAIVERNFKQDIIEKYYSELIYEIRKKDPDFNLRTYMDNMLRLRYLPTSQRKVIAKIEEVTAKSDPEFNKLKKKVDAKKAKQQRNR